ncbi:TRAP transporter large permease [Marinibaculum pumilum]|uniref:TRAP transporter large permease protein n=1 Tax=Marinibaculum pumilum TaxID=1766165 RepID=A0ABV7L5E8_9PROT
MIDPNIVGYLMIAGLCLLLVVGMPIAFALGLTGLAGLAATRGTRSLEFLAGAEPFSTTANLTLIIVPLSLFMGHLALTAGLSERAFAAARAWVGHVRGGLAIASVFACAGFATVTGASVATAATMSRIAIPQMLLAGYSQRMAAGAVAAGGTLGVLIPPSGVLVIYSLATGVSLTKLLVAAVVPGVLTAIAYAIGISIVSRFDPQVRAAARGAPADLRTRLGSLARSWEVALLFLTVMGAIYGGVATPTEATAVGAGVALLIALRHTAGRRRELLQGLVETGFSSAAIFALILGSALFSLGFATTQLPQALAGWVAGFDLPPALLTVLLLLPFLVLGAFIDGLSMILLTMPTVFPVVQQAGIDPILFGILVTKMTEIGVISPPVGLNVFVVKGACPELSTGQIFRGCVPFILIEFVLIALLIAVPELTTVAL